MDVPPDHIEQWTAASPPGVRARAGDATIALHPVPGRGARATPALPAATQDAIEDDGL
jgi:hypothetical protein